MEWNEIDTHIYKWVEPRRTEKNSICVSPPQPRFNHSIIQYTYIYYIYTIYTIYILYIRIECRLSTEQKIDDGNCPEIVPPESAHFLHQPLLVDADGGSVRRPSFRTKACSLKRVCHVVFLSLFASLLFLKKNK